MRYPIKALIFIISLFLPAHAQMDDPGRQVPYVKIKLSELERGAVIYRIDTRPFMHESAFRVGKMHLSSVATGKAASGLNADARSALPAWGRQVFVK